VNGKSQDCRDLREKELQAILEIRAEAKELGINPPKTKRIYKGKNTSLSLLIKRDRHVIDTWGYVQNITSPNLWPRCKRHIKENPNFILIEDNASCHNCCMLIQSKKKKVFQR
jgi:hypothetical protein